MQNFHSNSKKISLRWLLTSRRRLTADLEESAFLDSLDRALTGAGAAADTNVGIDDELVFALGDSLDGALVGAGAALNTSISNVVSHDFPSNMFVVHADMSPCTSILTSFSENAIPFFEFCGLFFMPFG
jgi:hypothetical protein